MGNNHQKYFGSNRRKIIVLGFQETGKSTLVKYIYDGRFYPNLKHDPKMNIFDVHIGQLDVTLFDLPGNERQRVFWKQHYIGTQGVIFAISAPNNPSITEVQLAQFSKIAKNFSADVPIALVITKNDQIPNEASKTIALKVATQTQNMHPCLKVFSISYDSKDSVEKMLKWLLEKTKPL